MHSEPWVLHRCGSKCRRTPRNSKSVPVYRDTSLGLFGWTHILLLHYTTQHHTQIGKLQTPAQPYRQSCGSLHSHPFPFLPCPLSLFSLSHNLTLQEFNKTTGHPYKLVKRLCSHDIYKHFYTNRVVDLWNNLPNDVISAKSLHSFKCKLRMLNFSF